MEAKLIKVLEHYHLYVGDKAIATTIVGNPMLLPNLSLKNCQAIELGYDLDELIDRAFDNMGYHSTVTHHEESQFKLGYKVAFKEAIEILVNEKFNRQDVIHALTYGVREAKNGRTHSQILEEYRNTHLIQQTEWDVEIVTTKRMENGKSGLDVPIIKPKLDADGCLILKKI